MEQPINQSIITFEGFGCDKRRKHQKLCKGSAALLCTLAVSLNILIKLQVEVWRFCCRMFHCLAYFLKI